MVPLPPSGSLEFCKLLEGSLAFWNHVTIGLLVFEI